MKDFHINNQSVEFLVMEQDVYLYNLTRKHAPFQEQIHFAVHIVVLEQIAFALDRHVHMKWVFDCFVFQIQQLQSCLKGCTNGLQRDSMILVTQVKEGSEF